MLDPQLLRSDIDAVAKRLLEARGVSIDVEVFKNHEKQRKAVQMEKEALQARRNATSTQVGIQKSQGNQEKAAELMRVAAADAEQLKDSESRYAEVDRKLKEFALGLPNIPHESVPVGKSSDDNVEVRRVGAPRAFAFAPKDHADLGAGLKLLDFDVAAKIAGARFAVMRSEERRVGKECRSRWSPYH